jgi:hypothetical protein
MINIKPTEAKADFSGHYNPASRFPGTVFLHAVPKTEGNKYITGLDEYSPSIRSIEDEKERVKAIAEVTKRRKRLERATLLNLDQDTPEGNTYFADLTMDLANLDVLNPKDPRDEVIIAIINENMKSPDFPVASSLPELKNDPSETKEFYIVNESEELKDTLTITKLKQRALTYLLDMEEKDQGKLRMVARVLLPVSIPISNTTDIEYIYKKLSDYIENNLFPEGTMSLEKSCSGFITACKKDKKELDLISTVSTAINYNIISKKIDNNRYYNRMSGFEYGPTIEDIHTKLANPANQEELGIGLDTDNPYSLKAQIKKKELIN